MKVTVGISQQKHKHNYFISQKTENCIHSIIKPRVGRIKSQIYKNMKIFLKRLQFINIIIITI